MLNSICEQKIHDYCSELAEKIDKQLSFKVSGVVSKIIGMKIETSNLFVPVGASCRVMIDENHFVNAEVIGFSDNATFLMALENIEGIKQGSKVEVISNMKHAAVDFSLLGRVIDAKGNPIDERGAIYAKERMTLTPKPINPLLRKKISTELDVGIRAINALLTVGKGQRLGIFAESGVGKSVLLGMMTRFTSADVVIVGLIGERGREIKEFIEENLGENGLKKSVIIAAAADTSPLMRVNGAILATTIAEYFRDQGKDVLLILDSLTRFAQAHREIALSIGELPATKGFTPSVFAKVSQLVERSGNGKNGSGSITAFYTVLIENEEQYDPIGEHVRSVIDGHIVLAKQLADAGHYPAIDIEKSISRIMAAIVDEKHQFHARKLKKLYSIYNQNKDLIHVGMYQRGSSKIIDEAISYKNNIENFLLQSMNESCDLQSSISQLLSMFNHEK